MRKVSVLLTALLALTSFTPAHAQSILHGFITRKGNQLIEDGKPYRFVSFNIPNLTYTEDNMRFETLNSFRLPTVYEIDDALATIQQMGGGVVRIYVLSVKKTNDPVGLPRHILAVDKLNEEAMLGIDQALEIANKRGVRLIMPFIDQASWWGGIEEFAAFRGKSKNDFYTDPQVREDFKNLVKIVLNRVNTRTGIKYKDDPAILAWELGNELRAPKEWVREMAPVVKQLDTNHLVAESYFTDPDNDGVDIVQDHLSQGDPLRMTEAIHRSLERLGGKKVYMVGEFGFVTTEGMLSVIDTVMNEKDIAGGLIWSLRFHDNDGGYYWHHEPHGGDFFKAYHWPGGPAGEPYDETRFMHIVRQRAYAIKNLPVPPIEKPAAPDLFSVTDGGVVTWRGATGAANYDLQRAEQPNGPWGTIEFQLTDDAAQYRPLGVDETAQPGHSYYYRLIARNEAGLSDPSKVLGPVKIRCHTLVDELPNMFRTYRKGGKLELRNNDARNYKEDCHRLYGAPGAWVSYRVGGRISAVRVYAFGEKDAPDLEFRTGDEGNKGDLLTARTDDYFGGKDMYNFRAPRLYTLDAVAGEGASLNIQFKKESQISRVEIEYQ